MEQASIADWLHWWQQGWWQQAEAGWTSDFFALPLAQQQALSWQQPQAVAASFGIAPALPPEPPARMLALIAFDDERWQRLLALLAATCAPQAAPSGMAGSDLIWCRRLSKGLRCGSWLDAACFHPWPIGGLLLLRALHPESWPRLRLRFPPEWAAQLEEYPTLTLPHARLAALYDAAIWQCQQSGAEPHVDH
ncbi:type III secretion protein HrpD [Erwinia sp. 198]|uniref:type III secretion protein HrpD n=1 Tax=Erwinia sp. 198 TaxID=2022746 RepID=UPI000F6741CA|nr:type III secretion protein HrpD [Erwinia sp. 198]RRZ93724.1 type III secretion protein HrpD [Erwinia sp. 198]